jgi:hypothetical protein
LATQRAALESKADMQKRGQASADDGALALTFAGNRPNKLWMWLTEHTGSPHLDKILASDITMMQLSDSKEHFEHNFDRVHGQQRNAPADD